MQIYFLNREWVEIEQKSADGLYGWPLIDGRSMNTPQSHWYTVTLIYPLLPCNMNAKTRKNFTVATYFMAIWFRVERLRLFCMNCVKFKVILMLLRSENVLEFVIFNYDAVPKFLFDNFTRIENMCLIDYTYCIATNF